MKLLVVQCAALGHDLWRRHGRADCWSGLAPQRMRTVFPAVTCTAQATFRTASPPAAHGMIANGLFDRRLRRAMFWEQSAALYDGARIWEDFRRSGGTVGQICWQQSLGEETDMVLSPAPIHRHHGGMIQDCYSRPADLYRTLCERLGRAFNLRDYWGPRTSFAATDWIADAACALLAAGEAPDLLLVYLPHLDYELQKNGPAGPGAARAFAELEGCLTRLLAAARAAGHEALVWGDYAITPATTPVYPNRALREAGWFAVREVRGRWYPDLYASPAFALVDHQVAHVYLRSPESAAAVGERLRELPGVARVVPAAEAGLAPGRAGDLVMTAAAGAWFAYPWWEDPQHAPDYATHVDIHNKPGFDPAELFFAWWPPFSVSQDHGRIRGTHGLAEAPEHDVLWGATLPELLAADDLVAGAALVRHLLGER